MASRGWYAEKMLKLRKHQTEQRRESNAISAIDEGNARIYGPKPAPTLVDNTAILELFRAAGINYVLIDGRKYAI